MKVDLLRPLSAQAFALLPAGDGKFLFSGADGRAPISNIAQRVEQLQKASGTSGWTMHDLRRTAGTLMSRAGVDSDIAERCLGHVIGGVRGVYDRHEYAKEKQRACEALTSLVDRIVDPPTANVTALRRATQS